MSTHLDTLKTDLDRFCAAWKTNDGAALGSCFAEDGTLINPFGERANGRAGVAKMYTEYFGTILKGTTTTFEVDSVRAVDHHHALVDAAQPIFAPDGSTVLLCHITALMRREGDAWRFVDARPYVFASGR